MTEPIVVSVLIEIPRGSRIKRGADGAADFISPFANPFDYGCIPGTLAGDGDPIDAIVLSTLPVPRIRGEWVETQRLAVVDFVDAGQLDPKWICGEVFSEKDRLAVTRFFTRYARMKRALYRFRREPGPTMFRGFLET